MQLEETIAVLKSLANPDNVKGMARFGINPENTLGISIPELRRLARKAGKDHQLAEKLWQTGLHEARILAGMVDDPVRVSARQMESWVKDFDSWDVCDQVCMNLFARSSLAFDKAFEWAVRSEEFTRRAGFALMACLAWSNKEATNDRFAGFLPVIEREAADERNYVKKSVNWALRQIGKRNMHLNSLAVATAQRIAKQDSKSARWVASDALRELTAPATLAMIKQRQEKITGKGKTSNK
jgi:3-methyladenine DNA glycosylase AlkD